MSAPNLTRIWTFLRLPIKQDWWRAVWPSLSYRFMFIFSSRLSRIFCNSSQSPFRTTSRKYFWIWLHFTPVPFMSATLGTMCDFDGEIQCEKKIDTHSRPSCESRDLICLDTVWRYTVPRFTVKLAMIGWCYTSTYWRSLFTSSLAWERVLIAQRRHTDIGTEFLGSSPFRGLSYPGDDRSNHP